MIKNGIVIKNISDSYSVFCDNKIYNCKARGKFRLENSSILVGDHVSFDIEKLYILEIFERKNLLKRPAVANVDVALIVTSLKEPNLSLYLLDKLISMVVINQVEPVICLTKEDLLDDKEKEYVKKIFSYYKKIGIKVFYNYEDIAINNYLKNKIVTLAGQTGAGKSSLLNFLDNNLHIATSPISKALGRGVHTTRHTEIYDINGIWFLDTPGFSSLDLHDYDKEDIKNSFVEFIDNNCLYNDCSHINTSNCDILDKVNNNIILKSRYENYCLFIKEYNKR